MPPGSKGIVQEQTDETNPVPQDDRGIRYFADILKELDTSLFCSRSLFVSSLFSGTYSAALHYAVEKSTS